MQREMPVPRYYQIFHQLEKSIQENTYAPGDKLPSEKELQLTFDVSRITARRALEEMERNGFVTRRRGKGTYVAKQPERPKLAKFTGSIDQLFMVGQAAAVTEADVEQVPAPHKVKLAL
jgi:GntR family transcriptional regulator